MQIRFQIIYFHMYYEYGERVQLPIIRRIVNIHVKNKKVTSTTIWPKPEAHEEEQNHKTKMGQPMKEFSQNFLSTIAFWSWFFRVNQF